MNPFTAAVLRQGANHDARHTTRLFAGGTTLLFETHSGAIRGVTRHGDTPVSALRPRVLDHRGDPLPLTISGLHIRQEPDSFHLHYHGVCCRDGVLFEWRGEVIGAANGEINCAMKGIAGADFEAARVGLTLEWADDLAGRTVSIERVDGTTKTIEVARAFANEPVARDVRSMTFRMSNGTEAVATITGMVGTLTDLRPSGIPGFELAGGAHPSQTASWFETGREVEQSIRLTLLGKRGGNRVHPTDSPVSLKVDGTTLSTPVPVGLCASTAGRAWGETAVRRLRELRADHLRVDVDLAGADWETRLTAGLNEAGSLALPAWLILRGPLASSRSRLVEMVRGGATSVVRLAVEAEAADEPTKVTSETRQLATKLGAEPMVALGDGARIVARCDADEERLAVAWPVTSAFPEDENTSVIASLRNLPVAVADARARGVVRPAPSPIGFRPSPDWFVRERQLEVVPDELPPFVDLRQMSLFGAAWTVGLLAALQQSGAEGATLFETLGWRGVLEGSDNPPLAHRFHSRPDMVFPLYHVLADRVGAIRLGALSTPADVAALLLERTDERCELLVANLTDDEREVEIAPGKIEFRSVRMLDETNCLFGMREPERFRAEAWRPMPSGPIRLRLLPYAVALLG